jgi:hypothetical protein
VRRGRRGIALRYCHDLAVKASKGLVNEVIRLLRRTTVQKLRRAGKNKQELSSCRLFHNGRLSNRNTFMPPRTLVIVQVFVVPQVNIWCFHRTLSDHGELR